MLFVPICWSLCTWSLHDSGQDMRSSSFCIAISLIDQFCHCASSVCYHKFALGFQFSAVCVYFVSLYYVWLTKYSCSPIRFLCRTPSHKVLMCIVIMLGKYRLDSWCLYASSCILKSNQIGSYISNQAWNLINSQSSIFHEWLPRAAKMVGK